jgi:hypothetical protein
MIRAVHVRTCRLWMRAQRRDENGCTDDSVRPGYFGIRRTKLEQLALGGVWVELCGGVSHTSLVSGERCG